MFLERMIIIKPKEIVIDGITYIYTPEYYVKYTFTKDDKNKNVIYGSVEYSKEPKEGFIKYGGLVRKYTYGDYMDMLNETKEKVHNLYEQEIKQLCLDAKNNEHIYGVNWDKVRKD